MRPNGGTAFTPLDDFGESASVMLMRFFHATKGGETCACKYIATTKNVSTTMTSYAQGMRYIMCSGDVRLSAKEL